MTKIRTVSETKRDFHRYHSRPINSIYRRFVEELLVEVHLLQVNVDFGYDPVFALGVVTSFERFMQGYQPQPDKSAIFQALCRAVGYEPEQLQRDAQDIQDGLFDCAFDELLLAVTPEAELVLPNARLTATLNAIRQNPKFKYSRLWAIGLYTLLTEANKSLLTSEEKRDQVLGALATYLHLSADKLQKDLELYRSNLDKVDQLLKVLEETAEAERKKREKQAASQDSVNNNEQASVS
ncbi:MAG: photosystem II biogenesis protein Psp29 [Microcystaceae cyanobacterium]